MTTAMYDAREAIIPGSVYDRSSQGKLSWKTGALTFPRPRLHLLPPGLRRPRAALASVNGLHHGPSILLGLPVLIGCLSTLRQTHDHLSQSWPLLSGSFRVT